MYQKLIDHFEAIRPLNPKEKALIRDSVVTESYTKGEHLPREGHDQGDTYFVLEGLVRAYQLREGEELTTYFYRAGQWIIPWNVPELGDSRPEHKICMEATRVVLGNEAKAQALFQKAPQLETVARQVMERAFAEQQAWLQRYHSDTPEERYLELLESSPEIWQKVPQYQIASFIGVKPESLSRIRKRTLR